MASGAAYAAEDSKYPAGAARPDSTTETPKDGILSQGLTAQHFAWEAAVGGLKEIRLSQVALDRTQNPKVKDLANRMIQDHSKANQDLTALAETKGIALPSTNLFAMTHTRSTSTERSERAEAGASGGEHVAGYGSGAGAGAAAPAGDKDYLEKGKRHAQSDVSQAVRKLENESGAQFDQDYLSMMSKDHAKAIKLFERASESLNDAELKQFASVTLPILREHARDIQSIEQQVASLPSAQVRPDDANR
jgi:putative membrane protein